jgi:hypothetical protein
VLPLVIILIRFHIGHLTSIYATTQKRVADGLKNIVEKSGGLPATVDVMPFEGTKRLLQNLLLF